MKIIVDQLVVNYSLTGKGKTILLLHGWGDDIRTFAKLRQELDKDYQTVALDLPGFGASQAPKEVWGLDDYANFIAHFLKKLELTSYAIIGHSNGGALAIRGLATGKIKSDKLVLIAAAGIRNKNGLKKFSTKVVAKTGKAATFWLPNDYKQRLRKRLYGTIGSDLLVMPYLEETFKKTVRQDVQKDAAALSLPTLLIFADRDPAIPLEDGKTYHALIKQSELKVLKSSDHFVHHDQPGSVLKLIKEFL